jgi:hypothetical protein
MPPFGSYLRATKAQEVNGDVLEEYSEVLSRSWRVWFLQRNHERLLVTPSNIIRSGQANDNFHFIRDATILDERIEFNTRCRKVHFPFTSTPLSELLSLLSPYFLLTHDPSLLPSLPPMDRQRGIGHPVTKRLLPCQNASKASSSKRVSCEPNALIGYNLLSLKELEICAEKFGTESWTSIVGTPLPHLSRLFDCHRHCVNDRATYE